MYLSHYVSEVTESGTLANVLENIGRVFPLQWYSIGMKVYHSDK